MIGRELRRFAVSVLFIRKIKNKVGSENDYVSHSIKIIPLRSYPNSSDMYVLNVLVMSLKIWKSHLQVFLTSIFSHRVVNKLI
jgi:hypothetical protein